MAEETQNLVPNGMTGESAVEVESGSASMRTCNRGNLVTALSVFVGILIVGQAVTVYFVTQQHATITALDETTKGLKLDALIKNLPGSPPGKNKPKMRMAAISMPLLSEDGKHSTQNLEDIARTSNKIEDAAKYMLLRGNPLRKYSSFNGTILDNLRNLRKTLSEEEWMVFDSWMQQWYLFYLVQNTKTPETAPASNVITTGDNGLLTSPERRRLPAILARRENLIFHSTSHSTDSLSNINDETPSDLLIGTPYPSGPALIQVGQYMLLCMTKSLPVIGRAPLMTPCQIKASVKVMLGAYVPQCDENGDYTPMQCWRGAGYCWCVYNNGTEVPETRSRAKPDCSDILDPSVNYDEFYEPLAVNEGGERPLKFDH